MPSVGVLLAKVVFETYCLADENLHTGSKYFIKA